MGNNNYPKPVELLVVIVDKGKGKKVTKIFNETQKRVQIGTVGYGTAAKSLHDYLGLGESIKDIMFSVVPSASIGDLMHSLNEKLKLEKPNSGIAFTIPITSIASKLVLDFIVGE